MHATKERILKKALQYFTENDYQNSSLNSIAKAIGITKGGIYHYFESKDELLKGCMIYFFDMMKDIMEMVIGTEMEIGLEDLIRSFFSLDRILDVLAQRMEIDFLQDYSTYIYLLFMGFKKFPELKKEIAQISYISMQGLRSQLENFQAQGQIHKDIDCESFALQIIALSEGFMLFRSIDVDDSLKVKDSAEKIIKNLIRSLK